VFGINLIHLFVLAVLRIRSKLGEAIDYPVGYRFKTRVGVCASFVEVFQLLVIFEMDLEVEVVVFVPEEFHIEVGEVVLCLDFYALRKDVIFFVFAPNFRSEF